MGSSTGQVYRVTTFGESHGPAIGVVIEGCPVGLNLDVAAIAADLARRRPGQSSLTTQRKENDEPEILSGVFRGQTTGHPITIMIRNQDAHSKDYQALEHILRPGHADATYAKRYGLRDHRGGGRASARETVARVAAAAVARQWLGLIYGIEVTGWVQSIGDVVAENTTGRLKRALIEQTPVRCPDDAAAQRMIKLIESTRSHGDTIGGRVNAQATGVPSGWGSPVFDKLEADLAKACLSLPACKGFEIGSGFLSTTMLGSEHNDPIKPEGVTLDNGENFAGGVLGGITTGAPIRISCAFKPVSTIFQPQSTITTTGESVEYTPTGRHDPCVVPRAVPLVEAAVLLTLADHALRQPLRIPQVDDVMAQGPKSDPDT